MRQVKLYDQRAPEQMPVGSRVFYYSPVIKKGGSKKLTPHWSGPWVVTAVRGILLDIEATGTWAKNRRKIKLTTVRDRVMKYNNAFPDLLKQSMEVPMENDAIEDVDDLEVADGAILLQRDTETGHPFIVPEELIQSLGLPAYCPVNDMDPSPRWEETRDGEEFDEGVVRASTPVTMSGETSRRPSGSEGGEGCLWDNVSNGSTTGELPQLPNDSWDVQMETSKEAGCKRAREESWLPDTRLRKRMESEEMSLRPQYHREAKVKSIYGLPVVKTAPILQTGLKRQLVLSPTSATRDKKLAKDD